MATVELLEATSITERLGEIVGAVQPVQVSGLARGADLLERALDDPGVPQHWDPHPRHTALRVVDRVPRAQSNTVVLVEVTYQLPENVQQQEPQPELPPAGEQVGPALLSIETTERIDESSRDIDGVIVTVGTGDDVQTGRFQAGVEGMVLLWERVEEHEDPIAHAYSWNETLNSVTAFSIPPGFGKMNVVSMTPLKQRSAADRPLYRVRYSVTWNELGWQPWVEWRDSAGNPKQNPTPPEAYIKQVEWYVEKDWTPLGLELPT